jgi:hypothetical protein
MKIPTYKEFESVISRDKDQEIFNYKSMINNAWRSIVKESQDFYNIHFDLENDETTGTKKTILVPKNLRKDQPIKYEFNCESFEAGGDWEMPVLYFRVEFTHDYGIVRYDGKHKVEHVFDVERKYSSNKPYMMFDMHGKWVLIPDVDNGNFLVKNDNGSYRAYQDEDLVKEGLKDKDVLPDEKKAWKWLENLLIRLVKERHEMLDSPDKSEPSPVAPDSKQSDKPLVMGVDPVAPILPIQPEIKHTMNITPRDANPAQLISQ